MKRFFVALGLIMAISSSVYAEVFLAPQWSEFCPSEYLTAQSSKFSSNKTYWYNRKIQFDVSLRQCSAYSGEDLKSCYDQVRQAEATKNLQWEAKLEKERQELQTLQQMNTTNSAFSTLNNLIDKIK